VGPNAAGKSNFLDVFKFLRDLARVGGGLQSAVKARDGMSAIRSLFARIKSKVRIAVRVTAFDDDDESWAYDLTLDTDEDGRPIVHREVILRDGVELATRPNERDEDDPEQLRQTYLEQTSQNREYRRLAEFFASVRYMHLVPQLIKHADKDGRVEDDPF